MKSKISDFRRALHYDFSTQILPNYCQFLNYKTKNYHALYVAGWLYELKISRLTAKL